MCKTVPAPCARLAEGKNPTVHRTVWQCSHRHICLSGIVPEDFISPMRGRQPSLYFACKWLYINDKRRFCSALIVQQITALKYKLNCNYLFLNNRSWVKPALDIGHKIFIRNFPKNHIFILKQKHGQFNEMNGQTVLHFPCEQKTLNDLFKVT